MKIVNSVVIGLLGVLLTSQAHAAPGKVVPIEITTSSYTCHVLVHQVANDTLLEAIELAETEAKVLCGEDSSFISQSVTMTTHPVGCSVVAKVIGDCYKQPTKE